MTKYEHLFLLLLFIIGIDSNVFCQENVFNKGMLQRQNYLDTIDFTVVKNKIIIEAEVNGRKRRFMLDTGAPLVVSKSFYRETTSDTSLIKQSVTDANGKTHDMTLAIIDSVKVGKLNLREVPALLLDNNSLILKCLNIDGFIGSNVLRNSVVQFNTKTGKIIITDDVRKLGLQKQNASDITLDNQSNPEIKISINKHSVPFLFDSGSDEFIVLSNELLEEQKKNNLHIVAKGVGSSTMGAFGNGYFTTKARVKINNFSFCNVDFIDAICETTPSNISRIGEQILNYGIVTIDYHHRKMFFESFFGNRIQCHEKKWDLTPSFQNNTPVVGTVWSDKLAAEPGDIIMAIDGKKLPAEPCQFFLSTLLEGKEAAELTIKKKDESIKTMQIHKIQL